MEVHSLTIELLMDTLTIPDWFSLIFCIGKRALSDVMERMGAQNTNNTTTVTYTQQIITVKPVEHACARFWNTFLSVENHS